jgi:hypothetical protein
MTTSECCLPEWEACCCTCKHRLTDYHHCVTTGQCGDKSGFKPGEETHLNCICSRPRGYVCAADILKGMVHSGWSEHGMCEMHEEKACL